MQVIVSNYQDQKINGNTRVHTDRCALEYQNPNGFTQALGGVDHFRKRSIDALVKYYVRRLQKDSDWGFEGANYTIAIGLVNVDTGAEESVKIPVQCR